MNLLAALVFVGTAASAPSQSHVDPRALEQRLAELETRLARVERAPESPPRSPFGVDLEVPEAVHWTKAVAWNADVNVLGAVSGPVVAVGGDLWVGPSGLVTGHLVSLGGAVHIHPDAVVHGDALALPGTAHGVSLHTSASRRLSAFLAFTALILLQINFAEQRTRNIADTVRTAPVWHALGGAILVSAGVVGGSVALASLVAAPVGLTVFAVLGATVSLGLAGFCRFIGDSLPTDRLRTPGAAALAGTTLLSLLANLPAIGPLLAVGAVLCGTGAAAVSRLGRRAAVDI